MKLIPNRHPLGAFWPAIAYYVSIKLMGNDGGDVVTIKMRTHPVKVHPSLLCFDMWWLAFQQTPFHNLLPARWRRLEGVSLRTKLFSSNQSEGAERDDITLAHLFYFKANHIKGRLDFSASQVTDQKSLCPI